MGLASAIPHPSSLVVSAENSVLIVLVAAACLALVAAAIWLIGVTKRLSHHSVWAHEHFSGATLAQFLYVAAQCGIFSFLINYMTSEPPSLPSSWMKDGQQMDRGPNGLRRLRLQGRVGPRRKTERQGRSRVRLPRHEPLRLRPSKPWPAYKEGGASAHGRPRRPDAGPQQPHPQDQPLCAGTVRRSRLAGQDQDNCSRPTPRRAACPGSTGCCSPTPIRRNWPSRTASLA